MATTRRSKTSEPSAEISPIEALETVIPTGEEEVVEEPVAEVVEEPVAEVVEELVAETPEVVVTIIETPEPAPVGSPFPSLVDEQLAGQLALIAAQERFQAEIEAGKRAVAEAEARARAAK